MKRKLSTFFMVMLSTIIILVGCAKKEQSQVTNKESGKKIHIVTTTTMLKDLIEKIGGDRVEVEGLMGEGVDPHLYQATASDIEKLKKADVVIYQGLHLEGKMGDVFASLKDKKIIEAGKGVESSKIKKEEDGNPDPHIWFDVKIWQEVGSYITTKLGEYYTEDKEKFSSNFTNYKEEMEKLDKYIMDKANEIPKEQRALVTAHDAFSYFADRYGFDVLAIQGVSTETEATTADIEKLASKIVERKIKAIFVESSVPEKTIKSLKDVVAAKGHKIEIGGELYSDSLGDKEHNSDGYINTCKANINIMYEALK